MRGRKTLTILIIAIGLLMSLTGCIGVRPIEEHDHGKIFAFDSKGNRKYDYVKTWCKSEECYNPSVYLFEREPSDTSYLEVIAEHIGTDGLIRGEYYTLTATVTLADYYFPKTHIRCEVRNDNTIVNFTVDFRDEFEDAVGLLQEGDEVTFRGRFYKIGCAWEDCELIK